MKSFIVALLSAVVFSFGLTACALSAGERQGSRAENPSKSHEQHEHVVSHIFSLGRTPSSLNRFETAGESLNAKLGISPHRRSKPFHFLYTEDDNSLYPNPSPHLIVSQKSFKHDLRSIHLKLDYGPVRGPRFAAINPDRSFNQVATSYTDMNLKPTDCSWPVAKVQQIIQRIPRDGRPLPTDGPIFLKTAEGVRARTDLAILPPCETCLVILKTSYLGCFFDHMRRVVKPRGLFHGSILGVMVGVENRPLVPFQLGGKT